jgi:hypothetical protein
VVCRHPSTAADAGAAAVWRTRISRSDSFNDGDIAVTAVSFDNSDPGYTIPLLAAERSNIVAVTQRKPAPLSRAGPQRPGHHAGRGRRPGYV